MRFRDTPFAALGRRRSLRQWHRAASAVATLPADRRGLLVSQARTLRRHLDRILAISDRPEKRAPVPAGADWAWSPEAMRLPMHPRGLAEVQNDTSFGQGLKIFHDSSVIEITLRQVTPRGPVALDILGFTGDFLSVVIDVPPEAGLTSAHILTLSLHLTLERPLVAHARLNVQCGPNTESSIQPLPTEGPLEVSFDLSHMGLDGAAISSAWVDLLFDKPQMARIVLHDVVLSRRAAAQF